MKGTYLPLVIALLLLVIQVQAKQLRTHTALNSLLSHLDIPKELQAKLMPKLMTDPEVIAAFLKDPKSKEANAILTRKMIALIKNDPALMMSMANDVFGKDIKFTDAEKKTLMTIILNHPEMMALDKH